MKTALVLVVRVIALTIVLFVCFAIAGTLVGQADSQTAEQAGASAVTLLAVCLVEAAILTHLILRSSWTGWRLMATVFFVYFGVTTFMSQIESAVFITRLPPGMLPRLFLMGAMIAAPFSVLAVLVLGKRKPEAVETQNHSRLAMPTSEWAWKLTVIAVTYVILYFTFGYFIAWRNPAVLEYYAGIDEGSFLTHMGAELRNRPWLVPFQLMRALFWVALALPVIQMMKGQRLETAVTVAVLFGVLMTARLFLPNPYMPESVRMAHFVETGSSNFLFGLFLTWLLTAQRALGKLPIAQRAG
jgi:hypothetical protein